MGRLLRLALAFLALPPAGQPEPRRHGAEEKKRGGFGDLRDL